MHTPNHIPFDQRLWNAVGAIGLLLWGGYGLYVNDLVIPLRRRRDIHLHDEPAFLMFVAFVCGTLVLVSVIADHYDRRNNEHKYEKFAKLVGGTGWVLFGVSLVLHFTYKLAKALHA